MIQSKSLNTLKNKKLSIFMIWPVLAMNLLFLPVANAAELNYTCLAPNISITNIQLQKNILDAVSNPNSAVRTILVQRKPEDIKIKFDKTIPKPSIHKVIIKTLTPYLKKLGLYFETIIFEKENSASYRINSQTQTLYIILSSTHKPKLVPAQLKKILDKLIPKLEQNNANDPEQLKQQLIAEIKKLISLPLNNREQDKLRNLIMQEAGELLEGRKLTDQDITEREKEVLNILNLQKGQTLIEFGPGQSARKGNLAIHAALKGLNVVVVDKTSKNLNQIKQEADKLSALINLAGGNIIYIDGDINQNFVQENIYRLAKLNQGFDHVIALSFIDSGLNKNTKAVTDYKNVIKIITDIKKKQTGTIYFADADEYITKNFEYLYMPSSEYTTYQTKGTKELLNQLKQKDLLILSSTKVCSLTSLGAKIATIYTFSKNTQEKQKSTAVNPAQIFTEIEERIQSITPLADTNITNPLVSFISPNDLAADFDSFDKSFGLEDARGFASLLNFNGPTNLLDLQDASLSKKKLKKLKKAEKEFRKILKKIEPIKNIDTSSSSEEMIQAMLIMSEALKSIPNRTKEADEMIQLVNELNVVKALLDAESHASDRDKAAGQILKQLSDPGNLIDFYDPEAAEKFSKISGHSPIEIKFIQLCLEHEKQVGFITGALFNQCNIDVMYEDYILRRFLHYLNMSNWLGAADIVAENQSLFNPIFKKIKTAMHNPETVPEAPLMLELLFEHLNEIYEFNKKHLKQKELHQFFVFGKLPSFSKYFNDSDEENLKNTDFFDKLFTINNAYTPSIMTASLAPLWIGDPHFLALNYWNKITRNKYLPQPDPSPPAKKETKTLLIRHDAHLDLSDPKILPSQFAQMLLSGTVPDQNFFLEIAKFCGIDGFTIPAVMQGIIDEIAICLPEEARESILRSAADEQKKYLNYTSYDLWVKIDRENNRFRFVSGRVMPDDIPRDITEQELIKLETQGYLRRIKVHIVSPTNIKKIKEIAQTATHIIGDTDIDFLGTDFPYEIERIVTRYKLTPERYYELLTAYKAIYKDAQIQDKMAMFFMATSSNFTPEKEIDQRLADLLETLIDLESAQSDFTNEILELTYQKAGRLDELREKVKNQIISPQDNIDSQVLNKFLKLKDEINQEITYIQARLKAVKKYFVYFIKLKNKDLPKGQIYSIEKNEKFIHVYFDLRKEKIGNIAELKNVYRKIVSPLYLKFIKEFVEFLTIRVNEKIKYKDERPQYLDIFDKEFISKLGIKKDHTVLDIGTGTAPIATIVSRYSSNNIFGIDLIWQAVQEGEEFLEQDKLTNIKLIQADATKIPFQAQTFDAVVGSSMMQHLPNEIKRQILEDVFRVLKPDGIFGLFVYSPGSEDRVTRWDGKAWRKELEQAGFIIDFIEDPKTNRIAIKVHKPGIISIKKNKSPAAISLIEESI
ncbi:MAG: methyltransferase domain-containing protein [Candidatus Omnitrophota bacterium]